MAKILIRRTMLQFSYALCSIETHVAFARNVLPCSQTSFKTVEITTQLDMTWQGRSICRERAQAIISRVRVWDVVELV